MAENKWVPFHFDGNQAWGYIDSPEEWERIKHAYKDSEINMFDVKNKPNRSKLFGLYPEYRGDYTLGEFATKHNMDIGYDKNGKKEI